MDSQEISSWDKHNAEKNDMKSTSPLSILTMASDLDLHLFNEGRHLRLWEMLGAHHGSFGGSEGVRFAVWAPNAASVSVVGDFNGWQHDACSLSPRGVSGVWEGFAKAARPGDCYKFSILTKWNQRLEKADPFAFRTEPPPRTGSVVVSGIALKDRRSVQGSHSLNRPVSVYEMHLGSFQGSGGRDTYSRLAKMLPDYLKDLGFTHVEFMPVTEHPFGGSWGYQPTSYFAPSARWGEPESFHELIDALHERGLQVILDWVPGHFATDEFALWRFDGTALYEHDNPLQGIHPDWGSAVFNLGRDEVRGFLLSSALFWSKIYGVDGIRVDAVASMLYLDYSRTEFIANRYGGRENIDAIYFLQELNEMLATEAPGSLTFAEESTAWQGVTVPRSYGGLGFNYKWNMGWMNDTLRYFSLDPVHRKWHHDLLTFGFLYGFSERFILPLSHDEVVHGKGSLIAKMPGDPWQKYANLRALFGWMWAHPGKKLLFMGAEFAQWEEWIEDAGLRWDEANSFFARGVTELVRSLNSLLMQEAALYELDHSPEGFRWCVGDDRESNVFAILRFAAHDRPVLCIANLAPVTRSAYGVGVSQGGEWEELLNTDSESFAGSNVGNLGGGWAKPAGMGDLPFYLELTLPPLGVLYLAPKRLT